MLFNRENVRDIMNETWSSLVAIVLWEIVLWKLEVVFKHLLEVWIDDWEIWCQSWPCILKARP